MPLTADQDKIMDLVSDDYTPAIAETDGSTTHEAGKVFQLGSSTGFVLTDVPINTKFSHIVKADQVRAKKAAVAIGVGAKVYYNDTNKNVTNVSAGAFEVGTCLEACEIADETVLINFDGRDVQLS